MLNWSLLNWLCHSQSVHELPEHFLADLYPISDEVIAVDQSCESFHCPVSSEFIQFPSFLEVAKQASKSSSIGKHHENRSDVDRKSMNNRYRI